jgi:DNA-binding MarR family transcriptional regulator
MAVRHYDARTFTCGASLSYLLKLSHVLMHDWAAKAFAPHDLSFIQWITLMKLREGSVATASDLCRTMHYDNGSVTRLVDQLEKRGLLRRERSTEDRRVVTLRLTSAGERKVNELIPVAVAGLNDALRDFGKGEFAELVRLLNKLIACLRAREAQGTAKGGRLDSAETLKSRKAAA